jgi:hypothetical protein
LKTRDQVEVRINRNVKGSGRGRPLHTARQEFACEKFVEMRQ